MPLIWENFFYQIEQFRDLTNIILIPQNFKSTSEPSNLQNSWSMRFLRKYISSMPFPELFVLPEGGCRYSYESRQIALGERVRSAISTAVFGNVIKSSVSTYCGAQNVFRFKKQLNKKKLLAGAFTLYYMQGGCTKKKSLWVKDTQTV